MCAENISQSARLNDLEVLYSRQLSLMSLQLHTHLAYLLFRYFFLNITKMLEERPLLLSNIAQVNGKKNIKKISENEIINKDEMEQKTAVFSVAIWPRVYSCE